MNRPALKDEQKRELGLSVRSETISILQSKTVQDTLKAIHDGEAAIGMPSLLPDWLTEAVLADLEADGGWNEECWQLDESENVVPISAEDFWKSDAQNRFSWNECLRKPDMQSYSLRGFLSALVSDEVAASLSNFYGEPVRFKSADMARYNKKGHYLRRHADLFEDRRFGFVWFFGKGWSLGDGGELIVEASSGSAVSVAPLQGTVAALLIRPDYFHQVTANKSESWIRYSIASHYHSTSTD